jgi:hypothetical protein
MKRRWEELLKKGQIKFSKKAAPIAKQYFMKKKANAFLAVVKKGEKKLPEHRGFYKVILGIKQDPSFLNKVYTKNIAKAKKFFEVSLLKEGRFNLVFSPKLNCALYISKAQQGQYKKIILPEHEWPIAVLNEAERSCISEFERKMNKTLAVDLADLILEMSEQDKQDKQDE